MADRLISLDWRKHKIGERKPCRICGQGALCRDANGHPCHKTCAERELAQASDRHAH